MTELRSTKANDNSSSINPPSTSSQPSNLKASEARRAFMGKLGSGVGLAAFAYLYGRQRLGDFWSSNADVPTPNGPPIGHLTRRSLKPFSGALPLGKAKRIIYLHQAGAPSQLDLFDHKPNLHKWHGREFPDSVRQGQRLTELTANQKRLSVAASKFAFSQHGKSGTWLSELLPHHSKIVDKICVVRSMHTEAINHVQAASFVHTGSEQPGRPTLGAWLSYGLGGLNDDLPSYVVLTSKGSAYRGGESLQQRLWSSGFLPADHQGVKLRSKRDPVLYLSNPRGMSRATRRHQLDSLSKLNASAHAEFGDPKILARMEQFEMAYRMQTSVPELADFSQEPESTFELYGNEARTPGTFAANCLMARRLAERDVRFIQLFHRGWDQHSAINYDIPKQAKDVDQASAALVLDLEQRGLLDDTLVVWGSEFGRTTFSEGDISSSSYGRDHHPRCFSIWLAGAGIRPGVTLGETDELGYNVVADPVHVHDLNASILHALNIDHRGLTFRYKGRDFRLTDVGGQVVSELFA